jgi:hypothetical protein
MSFATIGMSGEFQNALNRRVVMGLGFLEGQTELLLSRIGDRGVVDE